MCPSHLWQNVTRYSNQGGGSSFWCFCYCAVSLNVHRNLKRRLRRIQFKLGLEHVGDVSIKGSFNVIVGIGRDSQGHWNLCSYKGWLKSSHQQNWGAPACPHIHLCSSQQRFAVKPNKNDEVLVTHWDRTIENTTEW